MPTRLTLYRGTSLIRNSGRNTPRSVPSSHEPQRVCQGADRVGLERLEGSVEGGAGSLAKDSVRCANPNTHFTTVSICLQVSCRGPIVKGSWLRSFGGVIPCVAA